MKYFLCILALVLLALCTFSCSSDEPATADRVVNLSTPEEGVGLPDRAKPYPFPGNYYSFAWGEWAYSEFFTVDTAHGVGVRHWTIGLDPNAGLTPIGLAFDLDGTMYTTLNYMSIVPSECYSLLAKVDTQTGEVTVIGDPIPQNTSGPEIDACGNLYVLGFDVPHLGYIHGDRYLYRVDKYTAQTTPIGYTGDDHEWMDMAFDSQGRLWGTWGNKLYQIDLQTGAATFITRIYGVPGDPPPPGYTLIQEVMSIAFDENDILYGTAMNVEWDTGHGSPILRIDTNTGQATLLGYTELQYNHGGDTYPTTVRVAHRKANGQYECITVSMRALAAHLAHGDYVPGTNGHDCDCP